MASQIVRMYLRLRNVKNTPRATTADNKSFSLGKESFFFQKVLESECSQEEVFDEIGKPLIENVMRGSNGILTAFGPTNSGKTYSLLGEYGQEGIIPKIFEELFLRASLLKSKKTMGIVISYIEIDDDKIRDLIKILQDGIQYEPVDIREYQGHVYMDNLSIIQIDSLQTAINLIQEARKKRKASIQNIENTSMVHTLLKITVSQKEMNISKAGTLAIVELADSDSGKEHINKELEALKNLIVDLQQGHHASSDESMLTKILANNLKNNCLTSMLFHINGLQEKQTLNTLHYSNSCYLNTAAASAERVLFKSHQQADRIKKLQDEIKDLKHKIDKTQELHEGKLRSFGDIIGFNIDVEAVINAYPGSKARKSVEIHLNSCEALSEVENRNRRLEQKLVKNNKIYEEILKFEQKSREKNQHQIKHLEDQIKDVKLQIIELNEHIQDNVKKQISARTDDLQRVLLTNHMELEERAAVIHNLPLTLQSIASDMRAIVDYKEMGKAGLEDDLFNQYQLNEENHNKNISKLKIETDHALKLCDQETRRFENECNAYIREKFEKIQKTETEVIACYDIYMKQDKLIKDIESGAFNNGIKPVYMTIHDMPKAPSRERFP